MPKWAFAVAGGAIGGLAIWWIASRAIDSQFDKGVADLDRQLSAGGTDLQAQLRAGRQELMMQVQREVAAQIPPTVENSVRQTLSEHGITPATGQQIARLAQVSDTLLGIVQRGLL